MFAESNDDISMCIKAALGSFQAETFSPLLRQQGASSGQILGVGYLQTCSYQEKVLVAKTMHPWIWPSKLCNVC